ncbi:hypothetical protein ABW21_db0203539 [Orbilia brochopaga]|nr:hypothetical protein ABW21_db0203539 [Drechslerella brochopaga]
MSLRISLSKRGNFIGYLVKIEAARAVILERGVKVPSLPGSFVFDPSARFLARWNREVNRVQDLGVAVIMLRELLLRRYKTDEFAKFHVLKTPEQFERAIESIALEIVEKPSGPFKGPVGLYRQFHSLLEDFADEGCREHISCSPYVNHQARWLLDRMLHQRPGFVGQPYVLSRWITEYIEAHGYKGFRVLRSRGKHTRCCFCVEGQFDDIMESHPTRAALTVWQANKYSRHELPLHMWDKHYNRFEDEWRWIPAA